MDDRRTVKLGETYRSFAEAERRVLPIISKCLEGMVSAAKAVDMRRVGGVQVDVSGAGNVLLSRPPPLICCRHPPPQDSAIVVESFKSGFEPPGDFPFEDFSQNLSRTGSDGTISNTPKGDRDREGPPPSRTDPKHPMSRTKNKLWLFGKKPKVRRLKGTHHVWVVVFIYTEQTCRKNKSETEMSLKLFAGSITATILLQTFFLTE